MFFFSSDFWFLAPVLFRYSFICAVLSYHAFTLSNSLNPLNPFQLPNIVSYLNFAFVDAHLLEYPILFLGVRDDNGGG